VLPIAAATTLIFVLPVTKKPVDAKIFAKMVKYMTEVLACFSVK
jgi:hypothetical protein